VAIGRALSAPTGGAQQAPTVGSYKVLKIAKAGGARNFDYVYADVDGRRLYIPRTGSKPVVHSRSGILTIK
jgi:hypothetical protein